MTQQPQAKYRHDYRAPDYLITDIDLTFDLDAARTRVTAVSQINRRVAENAPLRLDGEDLTLISVEVDGQPWTHHRLEDLNIIIRGARRKSRTLWLYTAGRPFGGDSSGVCRRGDISGASRHPCGFSPPFSAHSTVLITGEQAAINPTRTASHMTCFIRKQK